MEKVFAIDFIRQVIEQTLLKERLKNDRLIGGRNQVSVFSFYENLATNEEVDRFVEVYRDIVNQQNKSNLLANGVVLAPENPTITNLNQCDIIPLTFTANFRCTMENRDLLLETLNNLIGIHKGRKVDIAEFDNGKLFMVGTFGNNINGNPKISKGDFLGYKEVDDSIYVFASDKLEILKSENFDIDLENGDYFYFAENQKIKVANYSKTYYSNIATTNISTQPHYDSATKRYTIVEERVSVNTFTNKPKLDRATANVIAEFSEIPYRTLSGYGWIADDGMDAEGHWSITIVWEFENVPYEPTQYYFTSQIISVNEYDINEITDDGTYDDVIFPPKHESFTPYKISLSFDSSRCDEPRNLSAKEYCTISIGGSATIVSANVRLGNDILKVGIQKQKIKGNPNIDLLNNEQTILQPIYWVEPLEVPSSNNANTIPVNLIANFFKTNSHTDSNAITLQYTFVVDTEIPLLEQLYDYARYGDMAEIDENGILTADGITPNIIYQITEVYNTWGNFKIKRKIAKLIESTDIENTESDVLSVGVSFQIQGEND